MGEKSLHDFQFVPAPAELQPYLNSLYVLSVGDGALEEMLPAYSGQLLLVSQGRGRMAFDESFVDSPGNAFFIGPLTSACAFSIEGPACILGASFTFHGWAALTRLPAATHGDRFVELEEAVGGASAEALRRLAAELAEGEVDAEPALGRLADILRRRLEPLPAEHARLIEATYAWLSSGFNPSGAALFDALPFSERQTQRLVKRFFGLPPARLKRRYRAIRAATLLADPATSDALRTEVIDAFYDQAHMIREIREFTGRTPRLLTGSGDSIVPATLGSGGYGAVRLFAAEEEEQLGAHPRPEDC